MKVLILGNGGREHSLYYHIKKTKNIKQIFCIPGNAGTEENYYNTNIQLDNFFEIKKFIIKNKIDIVIVGPELPLSKGIVDYLKKNNVKVFGPNKLAAKLESSKSFTKKICRKYNIPTAKYGIFYNEIKSIEYIKKNKLPIVIKVDGLAAGKGVFICKTIKQSKKAIKDIFSGKFGETKKVLIEEFLEGEEMSFFVISDGKNIKKFGTAQDHKRIFEGDKGPNTGGMGAYSPSRLENKNLDRKILYKIIKPTFRALKKLKITYEGFLYAGLMIVKNEPYLIEYNVRMGDPECQTILPRLKSNLLDLIIKVVNKKLNKTQIKWHNKKSICIVLASKGYPNKFKQNIEIKNLDKIKLDDQTLLFHAGSKKINNKILSNGGRVLNFVALSSSFKIARDKILKLIKKLQWKNGYYRKDIGYKVIK